MEKEWVASTTPAEGGEITSAAEVATTSLASCSTVADPAVVEPPKPAEALVEACSDEITVEELFDFDLTPPGWRHSPIFSIPPLADGEIYVGCIGNAAGELHHIILLPGDHEEANWKDQMEWAKRIGGDLPSRIEQAMLWANHRNKFKKDWYWSNETHHAESGWAWCQDFTDGDRIDNHKSDDLRARAVRRLPI